MRLRIATGTDGSGKMSARKLKKNLKHMQDLRLDLSL